MGVVMGTAAVDDYDDSDDDLLWDPVLAMEKERKRLARAAAQQEAVAAQAAKQPKQPKRRNCGSGKELVNELDNLLRGTQSRKVAIAKGTEQLEAELVAAMDTGVIVNPMLRDMYLRGAGEGGVEGGVAGGGDTAESEQGGGVAGAVSDGVGGGDTAESERGGGVAGAVSGAVLGDAAGGARTTPTPPLAAAGVVAAAQAAVPTAAPPPAKPPLAAALIAAAPPITAVPPIAATSTTLVPTQAVEARMLEIIARSAECNKDLHIPVPLLGAAIRAVVKHAREQATSVRTDLVCKRFPKLLLADYVESCVDGVPQRDYYMMGEDATVLICDWRVLGHTRFKCKCGSESLTVVQDEKLCCDKYSCFTLKQTGLLSIDVRTLCASPVLSCRDCSLVDLPMHDEFILAQIPARLRHHYPVDPAYATGDFHLRRELTLELEGVYTSGSAALANVRDAIDQKMAVLYERAAMRWHLARSEYLQVTGMTAALEPMAMSSDRKRLYGVFPTTGALQTRLTAKLLSDAALHTLELASLPTPEGGLLHVCSDDCDRLAKDVKLPDGSSNLRKLHLTVSAQTGQILGAVLTPDGEFVSRKRHIEDVATLHGPPRIWALDNLPTNEKEYKAVMPSSKLTTDAFHFSRRTISTLNSYSSMHGQVAKRIAAMYFQVRERGDHSVHYYITALHTGAVCNGGKFMIKHGRGSTPALFFTFKPDAPPLDYPAGVEPTCNLVGPCMPRELVSVIIKNGCFFDSLEESLAKDWRTVQEIKDSLVSFQRELLDARKAYQSALQFVRAQRALGAPSAVVLPAPVDTTTALAIPAAPTTAIVPLAKAVGSAAGSSRGALIAYSDTVAPAPPTREAMALAIERASSAAAQAARACSTAQIDQAVIDETARAAGEAAAHALALMREDEVHGAELLFAEALVPASGGSTLGAITSGAMQLVKEERALLHSTLESDPTRMQLLNVVGTYFNEQGTLEHTCTHTTLPALEQAIIKVRHLDRPPDVPRYIVIGQDSRGFDILRYLDGTNQGENKFSSLETVFQSNGGYSRDLFHGALLAKIAQLNEKARIRYLGGEDLGHCDLQLARVHNELMRSFGQPLPHPTVPPLAPRADVKQVADYYDDEMQRKAERIQGGTSSSGTSSSSAVYVPAGLDPTGLALAFLQPVDPRGPAPKRLVQLKPSTSLATLFEMENLPGIVPGMKTYGEGARAQIYFNLKRNSKKRGLCPDGTDSQFKRCPSHGVSGIHASWCEHGIIKRHKEMHGIDLGK